MLILSLDTSTAAGSAGVIRDDQVLAAHVGDARVPHGQRLPGSLLAVLAAAGVTLDDVDLFAVVVGPGAFTGLRIGIAAVQGLAFATGKPVVGVSALDALASSARRDSATGDIVAAVMDAARQEVFTALYQASSGAALEILEPPAVDTPAAVFARWVARLGERPLLAVGEGAVRYADALRTAIPRARLVESGAPLAAVAGRLALVAHREGRSGPPHAIRPLYVRRPDAELARERRIATATPLPRSS
jgi:tRNA threonylcarbamoyladenosine biosynthesis protein TsaB